VIQYPKRLIEVDLPIRRISEHARREKSIRHGHISTLHIWWARRPLAACRAVVCAALWPDPADPHCPQAFRIRAAEIVTEFASLAVRNNELGKSCAPETFANWVGLAKAENRLDPTDDSHLNLLRFALLDFIADFANWDNATLGPYLVASRSLTRAAHEALGGMPGTQPLVVDPFAGGGSIPLEALRVGADVFASDLNPVAVLLNKVLLEYIPKYNQRLANEVRKWGEWMKREAEREIGECYPRDPDGAMPAAFIWARTILSEAPGQGDIPIEVPLMRSMWLAKRTDRNRALRWKRDEAGRIQTEVVHRRYSNGQYLKVRRPLIEIFEPSTVADVEPGPSRGGAATCPISGFTTSVESVRRQLAERAGGAADARLMCVVTSRSDASGRTYRLPIEQDILSTELASRALSVLGSTGANGLSRIPDGKLNHLRGFFNIVLYGMTTWGDIFSPRQKLTLSTLTELVQKAGGEILRESDKEFAVAVQTCLALAVSRHADINASLAMWHTTRELITHVFGRQALPMVWDFAEANSFGEASGAFLGGVDWIARVLEQKLPTAGHVEMASATKHPLPEDSADVIFTDPPYYSAIPYADLSDFFYSWLRRALFPLHEDLFREELSPKDQECVSLAHRAAMYRHKNAAWFEATMAEACREVRRVDKPSGIGVVVFANKETSGWEAMLNALVSSGWTITASWPIDTEMGNRLRARNSAALASSIHLVCRPRENDASNGAHVGDWRDILQQLPRRIHEWMPRLAREGVVGADAIFACLGPALEVFSCYERVEKASGEFVTLNEYLEQVWAAVSKEALNMVFAGADASGFEEDARLTAMWLWTLSAARNGTSEGPVEEAEEEQEEAGTGPKATKGYVLEFDAARKIAQGLGARLESLASLVEVKGETARLLPVAERTRKLFGKDESESPMVSRRKKSPQLQLGFVAELEMAEEAGSWGAKSTPVLGTTVLDRIHQGMILFAASRGEALRRFLVDEGVGRDERFWRLAQVLSYLYPPASEEKRWVDGVLARKKGLGFG